jgi:thymidylate kinase
LGFDGTEKQFEIAGFGETDLTAKPSKIEYLAPLVKEFLGKEIGTDAEVDIGGVRKILPFWISSERTPELFIVIEGVDCSGKATVSKILADRLGAVLYKTPPKAISWNRDKIDAVASPMEHYRFYLNGIKIASGEIQSLIAAGKKVVCDRYMLTTYVYHIIMGVEVDLKDFADVIRPHMTFLLLVGRNEQAKRFLQRGMSIGERRIINRQQELAQGFLKSVAAISSPFLAINTDGQSPIEVAEQALKFIKFNL